jgi:hypothetical protein
MILKINPMVGVAIYKINIGLNLMIQIANSEGEGNNCQKGLNQPDKKLC